MTVRSITALVLAAIVAGCGSPSPAGSAAPSGTGAVGSNAPSGGTGTALLADAATLASLDEIATFENQLVDEFALAANLPADLGADTWAWANQLLHDELAEAGDELTVIGPASRTAALGGGPLIAFVDGGGAVGLAFAAGLILSGLGDSGSPLQNFDIDLDSTSDRTVNGERTVGVVDGHISLASSGSQVTADVEIGVEVTVTDAATGAPVRTGSFRSRGTIQLDMCPDANGKVKGRVTMSLSGGTSGAGSGTLEIEADVTGTVGDDAYLQTIEGVGQTSMTTASSSGPPRRLVTNGGYTTSVDRAGQLNVEAAQGQFTTVAEEGGLTQEDADSAARQIGHAIGLSTWLLASKAQEKWRGGECVEIRATEQSRDVAKNELVQFEARPWHKIEQRELAKPIVPAFAGKASLDPVDIAVPSPVLLSFKAGPVVDDVGTITLTSTSNRGIGKLTIVFTVEGGWVIDQAFSGGRITGLKCGDPTGEWIVEGTYSQEGFDGTQTWTMTIGPDGRTGTMVYGSNAQGTFAGITVFQTGVATGRVTLTILEDGTAQMDVVEEKRSFFSFTSVGGQGSDVPLPPRVYPRGFTWATGGNC